MTSTGQPSDARPDHLEDVREQNPTVEGPHRWYQARPGSRRSVNILGKDYPWWVAILVVLFIIV